MGLSRPIFDEIVNSGNPSASFPPHAVSYPAYEEGDLLVFHYMVDPDGATPDVAIPNGPGGETPVAIINDYQAGNAAPHLNLWYYIGNSTQVASTLNINWNSPTDNKAWICLVGKILKGKYHPDVISSDGGKTSGSNSSGTSTWSSAAFTASTDADNGSLIFWGCVDGAADNNKLNAATGTILLDEKIQSNQAAHLFMRFDDAVIGAQSISSYSFTHDSNNENGGITYILKGFPSITNNVGKFSKNRKHSLREGLIHAINFNKSQEPQTITVNPDKSIALYDNATFGGKTPTKWGPVGYVSMAGGSTNSYIYTNAYPDTRDMPTSAAILLRTSDTSGTYFSQRIHDSEVNWELYNNGASDVKFRNNDTTFPTVSTDSRATDGEWHLVSIDWMNGENLKFYLDGEFIQTTSIDANDSTIVPVLSIGNRWDYPAANDKVGANSLTADFAFVAMWNRRLSAQEHIELNENPWQIFDKPKRKFVPYIHTGPSTDIGVLLAPPPAGGGGTVEGSITFNVSKDYTISNNISAPLAIVFLNNLSDIYTNSLDKNISLNISINLDQINTNNATLLKDILFDISASQDQASVKVTEDSIVFSADFSFDVLNQLLAAADIELTSNFSYEILNQLVGTSSIIFNSDLNLNIINQLVSNKNIDFDANLLFDIAKSIDTNKSINFNTNLALSILSTITLDEQISFDIDTSISLLNQLLGLSSVFFNTDVTLSLLNNIITDEQISFDTNLAVTLVNRLIAEKAINLNIDNTLNIFNNLIANNSINFDINTNLLILNNIVSNKDITFDNILAFNLVAGLARAADINFNIDLSLVQQASAYQIFNEAISFIANVNLVPSNTITIERAINLITDLAFEYNVNVDRFEIISLLANVSLEQLIGKVVDDSLNFNIELDEIHSNTALKIGLLALNLSMDQAIDTQIDFNPFINLATLVTAELTSNFISDKSVNFSIIVDQNEIFGKSISDAISFALQSDFTTDIHLVANGVISFAANLDVQQIKQLITQSNITFGQLLGLSFIGSADLDEQVNFSIVQDFQVLGTTIQFELVTPKGRAIKVYFEDRTTIVDDLNRTIIVGKNNI